MNNYDEETTEKSRSGKNIAGIFLEVTASFSIIFGFITAFALYEDNGAGSLLYILVGFLVGSLLLGVSELIYIQEEILSQLKKQNKNLKKAKQ